MFLRCRKLFLIFGLTPIVAVAAEPDCCAPASKKAAEVTTPPRVLRVAADPNNLPFSNQKGDGFENKIAELIARELGAKIEYTWHAQRRGFFRETLKENKADIVIGIPARFELALPTAPYYRSSYVFVYRKDRGLTIHSFDDPQLRKLKVGVQITGNDETNPPPAHALANRGVVDNVVGFTVYGDYAQPNPPARIIEAVAKKEIDVAIAWGPMAGYFVRKSRVPMEVVPVQPAADPSLPFTYSIAMGVRRGDAGLRDDVNRVIAGKQNEINRILDDYGVPRLPDSSEKLASAK